MRTKELQKYSSLIQEKAVPICFLISHLNFNIDDR